MNLRPTHPLRGLLILGTALLYGCGNLDRTTQYNLDFEYTDLQGRLAQWALPDTPYHGYITSRDTHCRHLGQASLRLEQSDPTKSGWAIFGQSLPDTLVTGREVELSGWLRTEGVSDGFADLYVVINEEEDYNLYPLDTLSRGIRGTTEWHRISLRKQIPESSSGVSIGGILKGPGRAWFDDFEIRIDGVPLRDPMAPAPKIHLTGQEKRELRKYIHPLKGCDPTGADSVELQLLDRLVGRSSVVALGENSHGASEIYRMKERMIRYLATHQGFDQVAFETGMAEASLLDDYIRVGKGTAKAAIFGLGMWIWDTQEVLSLVEWMRQQNIHGEPIAFRGIDMQSADKAGELLYTMLNGDAAAQHLLEKIRQRLGRVRTWNSVGSARIDPQLAREIRQDLDRLENHMEATAPDAQTRTIEKQYVALIRQYLGMGLLCWRDRCMAENLLWIRQQNPESRIVLWAHNGHVSRSANMMGDLLDKELGKDYVSFGFTFHEGRYTGIAPDEQQQWQHDAQTAYPGTLEHLLHQLDEPIFLLDLRRMREERAPALEWINQTRFRHVGSVKVEEEFKDWNAADQFDYLIYIDRVTPSHLLF